MASFNLDLHGYKRTEALEEFISFYNQVFDNATNPAAVSLDVVHGYGSTGEGGVLLKRLRTFLETQGNCLEFTLGERADGNPGHTIVTPRKRLPGADAMLAEEVWDYCERPKSRSKILGQFRRHGDPQVLRAVRSLEKQGRLKKTSKGSLDLYGAA
jgi:hypothetical protein